MKVINKNNVEKDFIINNVPLGFDISVRCYYNVTSSKIIMMGNF